MITVCLFVLQGSCLSHLATIVADDRDCMQTHLRAEHTVGQVWIRRVSCSMSEIK